MEYFHSCKILIYSLIINSLIINMLHENILLLMLNKNIENI